MAIDFPASPNTGDHHTDGTNTWKWNGTYWARTKVTTKFTPSDTAPSDPTRMDFWYETDSGKLFVRHDASWVEVGHASDFGNDSARNIDGGTSSTNYGGLLTLDGGSSV